jgi:hypothetical protein
LTFTDFGDENETYKIEIYTDRSGTIPRFYMMFQDTENGRAFGLINYLGKYPADQRTCECNISEKEVSLFEAYIYIKGKIYRGCAKISLLLKVNVRQK